MKLNLTARWFVFGFLLLSIPPILALPAPAQIGIGVSVRIGPPALPVYEQPLCPGPGYLWTPGYWAWDDVDGYYWVPGTWVVAPVGLLWTPGYWGWNDDVYAWNAGYWGPEIGFYGGINYGFGYFGHGYEGGRWDNGHFFYNREVNNVNVTVIHNVYNTRINNVTVNRVSYNGGRGGINERPTAQEEAAERERHIPPVAAQDQHVEQARGNQELRASVNHGRPPIAATAKPGEFKGGVTAPTSEGHYNPPARGNAGTPAARSTAVHPNDLPAHERLPAPNTGDDKLNQKYQKQQDQLYAKQQKEHQQLQQKQDQEHARQAKQNASEAQKQQLEQKHQQQTQQMEQKHAQQTQHMAQQHQPPPQHESGKPK